MLCNMLGERSQTSLHLMILRDLPTLIFVPIFIQKKNKGGKKKTLLILNTGESKLYFKKREVLEAPVFFENPGYLMSVLCLWS